MTSGKIGLFSTLFSLFYPVMKHCISCLIYYILHILPTLIFAVIIAKSKETCWNKQFSLWFLVGDKWSMLISFTEGPRKSFPASSPITWQPLRDQSKVLTENGWPRTNKACRQKVLYLRSKYICYKDQLGYLIIEQWSNKLMVNTQL